MSKHWSILIKLISNAMTHHETVIMQSHLLTPARIKKLKSKLESQGVFTSFKVYRRKTTINEKLSVPLIYLLLHWSLPLLPSEGSTVIISAK
ncbi:TPA: pili assembly chaperone [Salmonella enterica subsp. enterica serovar Mississippi]|nr:pili assembly chaperone [Salmonella enterica subsp. enterica serovar Mississippi]